MNLKTNVVSNLLVNLKTAAFMAVAALVAAPAMADNTSITIAESNLDWAGLPTQIMNALATPIAVGIGICLSVFVVTFAVRILLRLTKAA